MKNTGNPQTENGFTKIANELLEALIKIRLPGEVRQILDCIFRQIYGFHKKEAVIDLEKFEEMTGLPKSSICRAIRKLKEMNMIDKTVNTYKIQELYGLWTIVDKTVNPKPLTKTSMIIDETVNPDLPNGQQPLTKTSINSDDPKETLKETLKKRKKVTKKFTPPTLEQVKNYITEKGYGINPEIFLSKNKSVGWVVGQNQAPMKDWKATIRYWELIREKGLKEKQKNDEFGTEM